MTITKDDLTVVVPVLNEEEAIGGVLQELKDLGYNNMVVVDGYSRDKTVEIAKDNGVRVVFQHGKGKTGAIRTAIEHVKTPYMLVMDGDLSYDPSDIERFLAHAKEYDQIIGCRVKNGVMGRVHRFGNWAITKAFNLLMDTNLSDVCSGMWLLNTERAERLSLYSSGFDVEVEVATHTAMEGRVTEVPITYRPRVGNKKLGTWREGIRILASVLNLAWMYNPALLFSAVASLAIFPALVILGWVILEVLMLGIWHSGWALFGVMLLLLATQALAVATISMLLKRMEARTSRMMRRSQGY